MNYNHLNINERTVISLLASSDVSIREIAKQLGRSPSTISRELKRNQTNEQIPGISLRMPRKYIKTENIIVAENIFPVRIRYPT